MTTLQEYLNQKYPTKEEKEKIEIISNLWTREQEERREKKLEGGELDLREFVGLKKLCIYPNQELQTPLTKLNLGSKPNLERFNFSGSQLTTFDLSDCPNLTTLDLTNNQLTSIEFLTKLPNPEKLTKLLIYDNNIQPTDIEIFSKFVGLRVLALGTLEAHLRKGKRNRFYGSFKFWQNLTKLESICIAATDVNEGLEYLPESLVQSIKNSEMEAKYSISCFPNNTNAKCVAIQNELRPFNYAYR